MTVKLIIVQIIVLIAVGLIHGGQCKKVVKVTSTFDDWMNDHPEGVSKKFMMTDEYRNRMSIARQKMEATLIKYERTRTWKDKLWSIICEWYHRGQMSMTFKREKAGGQPPETRYTNQIYGKKKEDAYTLKYKNDWCKYAPGFSHFLDALLPGHGLKTLFTPEVRGTLPTLPPPPPTSEEKKEMARKEAEFELKRLKAQEEFERFHAPPDLSNWNPQSMERHFGMG